MREHCFRSKATWNKFTNVVNKYAWPGGPSVISTDYHLIWNDRLALNKLNSLLYYTITRNKITTKWLLLNTDFYSGHPLPHTLVGNAILMRERELGIEFSTVQWDYIFIFLQMYFLLRILRSLMCRETTNFCRTSHTTLWSTLFHVKFS